ncbi:MAG: hypothetical protein IJU79_03305 [Desulfovibrionaceae bacterium]|nr:hypothetical protein [Desulfovibrionaceae bacterium]
MSNIVCKTQKYQFRADTLDFETQQDNRLELWLKGLELENSEQFNLQLPGELFADLHLAATVTQDALVLDGNFSIGQHCAVSFQVTPLFEQAAIKDLMLRLKDNGALAWVALNLVAPDELATLINQMLSQLKDKVSDDIKGMIFIDAVRAFLQKPGSIELKSIYGLPIKLDELKARLAKPADNFVVTSTQGSVPLEEQVQMLAS